MRKFALTALLGAASLGLAACGGGETETNNVGATDTGAETTDMNAGTTASAGADDFPAGARIVEENGAFYRVDADGTRTALGANDARIVVENGVRYRVSPSGTRVRIDEQGATLDVDAPDVDVDLPDVDVGINEKGNPDVDVKGGDVDVTTNDNR